MLRALKGHFSQQPLILFPSHSAYPVPTSCCCLLVPDARVPRHRQRPTLETKNHPQHTQVPNACVWHLNPPCTTPALQVHAAMCFLHSGFETAFTVYLYAQFFAAVGAGSAQQPRLHAGPGAAEPFWHLCLSPPNPLCWPQSDECLVKKQMAVTDMVRNCGWLIAEDKSEIRTKPCGQLLLH